MINIKTLALALIAALGVSGAARAEDALTLTIKDHKFDPAEVHVPADKPATLVVRNLDSTPEEFESKPLRIEKIVPPSSEARFALRPLKPGRYKFVGEFHEDTARGEIVVD